MRHLTNRKIIRSLAVAVLVMSTLTVTLPREFFDPHLGVDNDIFCILYVTFISDAPATGTQQVDAATEDDYCFDRFINFVHLLYIAKGLPIRAPPILSAA